MKKITRKALLTAKAYRPGKAGGGLLGGYTDPKTKNLEDWQWKPLADVQAKLGGLSEIPSHVLSFGQFMDQTAQRAAREGLRPRDLIKAYTITRASIQRQAINSDKLRAAGFDLPPNITGKIRPEGAFGEWLHSPAGQSYLDAAEKGQQHEAAIQNAAQVMKPFGKDNDLIDALRWAAGNLPGKEGQVSQLVAAGREKASTPDEWRAFTKNIRGIGPSKSGFVASLMGRGDQPTLDARQIILHTGNPAKEASRYVARKGGEGGAEAVNRLATRQEAMNLSLPQELSPYYQHLAHHAVWDKAGDEETTHQDVMQAMQHAATGGKIEPNHVSTHPVAQIMKAMGFPGLETEAHKADGGEIDDWHGVHEREAQHFADGGVAGAPQKTVKAYKLFKTKKNAPGKLFPLFVDANTPVPVGQWVDAKAGEPGKTPGKVKSKLGDLAFRPGWHAGDLPIATHIGGRSSNEQGAPPDYRPADQVWAEVEMPDDVDWQSVANSRGQRTKAGTIDPKTAHITDQVPAGGHYRYKTNSNMTGNWMIGGSMRVNRILSDDEVKDINDAAGAADLPRHPDYPKMAGGGRAGYADGGSPINALKPVGKNNAGIPENEAVENPLPRAEYPYELVTPAKQSFSEGLIKAVNKAHSSAAQMEIPIDQIVTDQNVIGRSKLYNPSSETVFIEKIGNTHHLRDGNHRVAAAFLRGDKTVSAKVADMNDAIKASGRTFNPETIDARYGARKATGGRDMLTVARPESCLSVSSISRISTLVAPKPHGS